MPGRIGLLRRLSGLEPNLNPIYKVFLILPYSIYLIIQKRESHRKNGRLDLENV